MNATSGQILKETINLLDGAYAPATLRAYRADFEAFILFCEHNAYESLPASPASVGKFIASLARRDLKSASIRRAIAGISTIHKLNRFIDPTKDPEVSIEMRRMHRALGRASNQAQAINISDLQRMISATDDTLRGLRNRALILVAYDTLCRRSELASLMAEDIKRTNDQKQPLKILLRRSKTDPDGVGRWLTISEQSQQALDNWIERSRIKAGAIFRGINNGGIVSAGLSPSHINKIYKKLAKDAGLDTEAIKNISGHSIRVGAAQDLLASGASMPIIMVRGRWTKTDTVMRYVENTRI